MRRFLLISLCFACLHSTSAYGTQLGGKAQYDAATEVVTNNSDMPPVAPSRSLLQGKAQTAMLPVQTRLSIPDSNSTQFRVRVSSEQHGEAAQGVLGAEVNNTYVPGLHGVIRCICPNSDLLTYGICSGDKIIAVDGQSYPHGVSEVRAIMRGIPGTIINLTVKHQGQIETIPVRRIDSRAAALYDFDDGYFKEVAARTKYW